MRRDILPLCLRCLQNAPVEDRKIHTKDKATDAWKNEQKEKQILAHQPASVSDLSLQSSTGFAEKT
ncbi:MAG TPA: hypothetical protein VM821_00605 [Abditibacteriaceae bacterium]|nr:hypothetical protein [Abditibacteriaceae bacterium]